MKKYDIGLDHAKAGHQPKKFICPQCSKQRMVKYFNFTTLEYLPEHFGRCDRESSCGYFVEPWEWLKSADLNASGSGVDTKYQSRGENRTGNGFIASNQIVQNYVDPRLLTATLKAYEYNNFFLYLKSISNENSALHLCIKYFIGTAKNNSTIFWNINTQGKITGASKILYNPTTGKRDKQHLPYKLFKQSDNYHQCLFGEHLITTHLQHQIAIVESEKTAIILSLYKPILNKKPTIYIATSGIHGATQEKIQILQNRQIILIPDFSPEARTTWFNKLKPNLERIGCQVVMFQEFEEIDDGTDLADHLDFNSPKTYIEYPNLQQVKSPTKSVKSATQSKMPTSKEFDDSSSACVSLQSKKSREYRSVSDFKSECLKNPIFNELVRRFDLVV